MSISRALIGQEVKVVLTDGTFITGTLVSSDEKFNVALKGTIRDSSLAGTPLELTSSNPNTVRVVRGEGILAVFSKQ